MIKLSRFCERVQEASATRLLAEAMMSSAASIHQVALYVMEHLFFLDFSQQFSGGVC